jgi:hypothetical protein
MKRAKQPRTKSRSANKSAREPAATDLRAILSGLAASSGVKLVDLTQTLSPDFPTIVLPSEMGQCRPFRMEEISRYDDRGPAW